MASAMTGTAFIVIKGNAFGKASDLQQALRICNSELGSSRKDAATVYVFDCPSTDVATSCGVGLGIEWPKSANVFRFTTQL